MGLGWSSAVENLPGMPESLESVPDTKRKDRYMRQSRFSGVCVGGGVHAFVCIPAYVAQRIALAIGDLV